MDDYSKTTPQTAKMVFKAMPAADKFDTLYSMVQYLQTKEAERQKSDIAHNNDMAILRGEIAGIGRRKNGENPTLTTSRKFDLEWSKRNAAWLLWRDKVIFPALSYILTLIIASGLYYFAQWIVNGKP